jgi:SAM-dependent methyltransferase
MSSGPTLQADGRRAVVLEFAHLRIGEGWFDGEPPNSGVHVRRWRMHPSPDREGVRWIPFDTLRLDLHETEETLLGQFDQTTRYEIRRAENRDALKAGRWSDPPPAMISDFLAFYGVSRAGALTVPRPETLGGYAQAGCLHLSQAVDVTGRVLVWHAYFVGGDIALLLHSCSGFRGAGVQEERQLYSRANRWLHWRDMQCFRGGHISTYDWGGYYKGGQDSGLENVNAFKRGFGGNEVRVWDGHSGVRLRGKLYLVLRYRQHRRNLSLVTSQGPGPAGPTEGGTASEPSRVTDSLGHKKTMEQQNRGVYRQQVAVDHYRRATSLQRSEQVLFSRFLKPRDRLLDLGIGAGRTTRFLRDRPIYVGLDIAQEMTAATFRDLGETRLVVASADMLPFADSSFDSIVFSFNGLGYLDSRNGVYNEVHRVLVPGGIFLFSLHNARFITGPTQRDLRSLVAWLPRIPATAARSVSSGRVWRGSGVIDHSRGAPSALGDLRSTCLARGALVREVTTHGFAVQAVLSAPVPGFPAPMSPWYYVAALRNAG